MRAVSNLVDNLKFSLQRYKENLPQLLLGYVLSSLIVVAIFGFPAFFIIQSIPFTSPSFFVDIETNLALYMTNIAAAIILILFAILVNIAFSAGQFGMAFESLSGKTSLKALFSVTKSRGLTAVIASILVFIILLLPQAILYVGLLYSFTDPMIALAISFFAVTLIVILSFFMSLYMVALVASNLSALDSIKTSISVVKLYWLDLLLMYVLFFVVCIVFCLIPIIGPFIAALLLGPLIWISLVKFYVDRTTTISTTSETQIPKIPPRT